METEEGGFLWYIKEEEVRPDIFNSCKTLVSDFQLTRTQNKNTFSAVTLLSQLSYQLQCFRILGLKRHRKQQ